MVIKSTAASIVGLKPYTDAAYHNEELKSLTRYSFDKVKECDKLRQSISRLGCILFPEPEKLVRLIFALEKSREPYRLAA